MTTEPHELRTWTPDQLLDTFETLIDKWHKDREENWRHNRQQLFLATRAELLRRLSLLEDVDD